MTDPEEAVRRAREEAARAGPPPPPGEQGAALERAVAPGPPSNEVLQQWAILAVDSDLIRSTRRMGGPLTTVKRGLLRFLRQYTHELESQQTRFNLAVVARLREIEARLESERSGGASGGGE